MSEPDIPDKMYFRIGEVASLTGVKPSVLRYWESEFGTLRPSKSRSNQRLYSRSDIDKVFKLKTLLYEKKFTIAGARRVLARGYEKELNEIPGAAGGEETTPSRAAAEGGNGASQGVSEDVPERIRSLISEARSIKDLLS